MKKRFRLSVLGLSFSRKRLQTPSIRHTLCRLLIGSLAGLTGLALQTARASNTWDGGAGGVFNWSDPGNWGGAAPNYGTISFSGAVGTTNILDGNFTRRQHQHEPDQLEWLQCLGHEQFRRSCAQSF